METTSTGPACGEGTQNPCPFISTPHCIADQRPFDKITTELLLKHHKDESFFKTTGCPKLISTVEDFLATIPLRTVLYYRIKWMYEDFFSFLIRTYHCYD